jgi:tetratricopeptide (TPR) repeat protein
VLVQQIQKNYYTPHFNPCWVPVAILGSKTIYDITPYIFDAGIIGYVLVAFALVETIKIIKIIIDSFSKDNIDNIGFMGNLLGKLFRISELIGKYIQQNSKEDDKLFVWGDQPSIYLYSNRQAVNTDYLFTYTHNFRIQDKRQLELLLNSLRENPPELFLFYNYKINDVWNMDKVQEQIGVPYRILNNFNVTDANGNILVDNQKISYNFPIYKRDDEKYKEILLDRAIVSIEMGSLEQAKLCLKKIFHIFPDDYETSVFSVMIDKGQINKDQEKYLEKEIELNKRNSTQSIALRYLADIYLISGDNDKAIKKYKEALNINPCDFRIYNKLGELEYSLGKVNDALNLFKKAFELHPYSAEVINNIGVIMVQHGNTKEAIKWFKKAISLIPDYPDAMNNLRSLSAA